MNDWPNPSSNSRLEQIAAILSSVRGKGVEIWTKNGQLHYRAPRGALTEAELEKLRESKHEIVVLIEELNGTETAQPRLQPRTRRDRAPLAFSQLAHWYAYKQGERRSMRQVTHATRLRGNLDIDALRRALAGVIRRHEALRTRIVMLDGEPVQQVVEAESQLDVQDLSTLPADIQESEVVRGIEKIMIDPTDVSRGPLLALRLLKLKCDDHVLIVGMDHVISDNSSMGIFLREAFLGYTQMMNREAICLPNIPIQFTDYAAWQRTSHDAWLALHAGYWQQRMDGCRRIRFPADNHLPDSVQVGWATVPLRIEDQLCERLRNWSRRRHTTLAMSLFTAYVALVLRWCRTSEMVVQYETAGRVSPDVENCIGYFASALNLRIGLASSDSFVDLLNRVTDEYCSAQRHADFSYLESQVPRPEFTRNTCFNWVPHVPQVEVRGLDGSSHALTCSQVPLPSPLITILERDTEPLTLLYDSGRGVFGLVYFQLNTIAIDTMERFARNYICFLQALLSEPDYCVESISLCD